MLYAPSNRSASRPKTPDPVGLLVLGLELVGQRVHEDLGVGVALQVVVALGEQLVLELLVVGELAVEGEGEPLGLAAVVALERLGVAAVVAAAGGVADVADRGRAVHARCMIASNSSRWLRRKASATVPTSLWVLSSALRSGR